MKGITRSYLAGPWIYLVATLVAFGSLGVSFIMFAAFSLFWVLESSIFGRGREAATEFSRETD